MAPPLGADGAAVVRIMPVLGRFGEGGDILDTPISERRPPKGRQRVAPQPQLDHSVINMYGVSFE